MDNLGAAAAIFPSFLSNTEQLSQPFRTDPNSYVDLTVEMTFGLGANSLTNFQMQIFSDDGAGNPNVTLGTLSRLTTIPSGGFTFTTYSFSGSINLAANTDYHIVMTGEPRVS